MKPLVIGIALAGVVFGIFRIIYTYTPAQPSTFGLGITGILEVMHSEMTILLIATLGVFVVGLVIGLFH